MPDEGRDFCTGNIIGDPRKKWANREVAPVRFMIKDEALKWPALETIYQILTASTDYDRMRRLGAVAEPDQTAG
jgi:hypothetical protein